MIKVFFSEQMVAQGRQGFPKVILQSPSTKKPSQVAKAIERLPVEFIEPQPVTIQDIKLAHDPSYVDGIFNLTEENGFGNFSPEIARSLPYTTGAMYDAAKAATADQPIHSSPERTLEEQN